MREAELFVSVEGIGVNSSCTLTVTQSSYHGFLEIGQLATSGNAYGIYVSNSLAYIAQGDSGLLVVDVSNPANPIRKGLCDTPGDAVSVHVTGIHAYVADGFEGLQTLNVSNPSNPYIVDADNTSGWAADVFSSGGSVFVADYDNGLLMFEAAVNPANPWNVDHEAMPSNAEKVYVDGSHVYVTGGDTTLYIYEKTDAYNVNQVGKFNVVGYARGVHVQDQYAYIALFVPGVVIIDVSNPSAPIEEGRYEDNYGLCRNLHVNGNYLYLANDILSLIDITNKSKPEHLGNYYGTSVSKDVVVVDGLIYVVDYYSGLHILKYVP
jgi:hypothetical protein